MIQAAATGSFDFSAVCPRYYTRLFLVLTETARLNVARSAQCAALHCALGAVGGSEKSAKENQKRMKYNHDIMRKMLGLEVEKETTGQDKLIERWMELYGRPNKETDSDSSGSPAESE